MVPERPASPAASSSTAGPLTLLYLRKREHRGSHRAHHPGDAAAQFNEVLRNLDALLEQAARQHVARSRARDWRPLNFKLYVLDAAVLEALGSRWRSALAGRAPTLVLFGDLCRTRPTCSSKSKASSNGARRDERHQGFH